METPWRKSLCKVVSKGEGSLEDLEQDGSTKSNLWSDAPFMSFTTLSRIVRDGVMLLQSRAVSHDRTVPTDRCEIKYNHNVGGIEFKSVRWPIELKTSGACFFNAPTRLNPVTNTPIPDRPTMLLFFRPDCKIS